MWPAKKKYTSSGSLSEQSWRRFKKNRLAYGSFLFILFSFLLAIFGYLITPDSTPMANDQNLVLSTLRPGAKIQEVQIPRQDKPEKAGIFSRMLFGEKKAFDEIPLGKYRFEGAKLIVEEYVPDGSNGPEKVYNLAEVVYRTTGTVRFDTASNNLSFNTADGKSKIISLSKLQSEFKDKCLHFKRYWLGTDRYGRDVLSQIIIGTRVSLSVGLISVLISLLLGIFMGALAGYFGGFTDSVISWIINVIWAVPTLLLVIAITFALGKGFWQVFIAVGLTMWVEVARVVRGQFMSLREKEYVEASKALGFRHGRIIFRHILPNALAPVIVISAANFASAILLEAGLSFLGIGVQPPMPSWGTMIRENYAYIILDYAYLAILPGLAIMVMVLAFMLTGNGLRDALDVRTID